MANVSINAESIGKKFSKSLKHVMLYGLQDIAGNIFGKRAKTDLLRENEFWAVDGVSFKLEKGERLGIIGPNGSGKTTVLKMLNGIFMPDKGRIAMSGRVGALIQVGAGFHPMLTGRENIYVNGAILGMRKKEIDKKFDSIVDFADIGDFLDSPVRHYSSGMYVRLGFAIAVHSQPDILLVDEILAVGDAQFYKKCTNRIDEMTSQGTTMVLVSHNMWLIQSMCQEVILLNKGKVVKFGRPSECIYEYSKLDEAEEAKKAAEGKESKFLVITGIEVRDSGGEVTGEVDPASPLNVSARYHCRDDKVRGSFFIRLTTPDGYPLYTAHSGVNDLLKGEGTVTARILSVSLVGGEYRLWAGVSDTEKETSIYDAKQIKLDVRPIASYPDSKRGFFVNKVDWNFE